MTLEGAEEVAYPTLEGAEKVTSLVPTLRTNTSSVEGAKMTPLVPALRTNNGEEVTPTRRTNTSSVEGAKVMPLVPALRTKEAASPVPTLQGWMEVPSPMMDSKGEPEEEMPSHVTILDAAGC